MLLNWILLIIAGGFLIGGVAFLWAALTSPVTGEGIMRAFMDSTMAPVE